MRTAWGLEQPVPARAFTPEQRLYLDYLRRQVFEKIAGGRRSLTDSMPERHRAE